VSTEDSTLSYLPLARIRVVEEFVLNSGAWVGYNQVGALYPPLHPSIPFHT